MMTPEQIEAELKHVATKEDLHKELHAQTRQFVTWMGLMAAIILGGVYFMVSQLNGQVLARLAELGNDVREIRTRVEALPK